MRVYPIYSLKLIIRRLEAQNTLKHVDLKTQVNFIDGLVSIFV
jgi:hypothetical protein